ncbi:hypothetical protein GGR57DRAFT_501485 [Xylariaceae sp. FL1272]|nr:hypothetical protein GGR57DRAFT_501485 [Xylariaceae sp. FL1272]
MGALRRFGLFMNDHLALKHPVADPEDKVDTREGVIICGASTSVGCNTAQSMKAAGYVLFAIASVKNFDYVKALAIGDGLQEVCIGIVPVVHGRRFVSQASITSGDARKNMIGFVGFVMRYAWRNLLTELIKAKKGVSTKFIWGRIS